jgi:hypothetical protein
MDAFWLLSGLGVLVFCGLAGLAAVIYAENSGKK